MGDDERRVVDPDQEWSKYRIGSNGQRRGLSPANQDDRPPWLSLLKCLEYSFESAHFVVARVYGAAAYALDIDRRIPADLTD